MDILLFEGMTAEQSLALATEKVNGAPAAERWEEVFRLFISVVVPALRAATGATLLRRQRDDLVLDYGAVGGDLLTDRAGWTRCNRSGREPIRGCARRGIESSPRGRLSSRRAGIGPTTRR